MVNTYLLVIKMVDLECSKLIPIYPIYPKFVDFWSVQIQKFRIFLSGRFPNEWFKSLIWLAECRPIRITWEPFSVPSMIISISTFWFQPMKAWCCSQWQSRAQTQIRVKWWVTWPPTQLSKWTRDGVWHLWLSFILFIPFRSTNKYPSRSWKGCPGGNF